jgi:PPOX class probable F420-dependent enzyme
MIDFTTEFGRRVAKKLKTEQVIWLTTVGPGNTPQPRPVWFWWDGTSVLIYSMPNGHKLRHIRRYPNVSLHFNSDAEANEVAVLVGRANVVRTAPAAINHKEYLRKYRNAITGLGMTPKSFGEDYSVAIVVTPARLRGF